MLKAYRFRIYPTEKQKEELKFQFGAVRWVYNKTLEDKIKAYKKNKTTISKFDTINNLKDYKRAEQTKWLKRAASQPLQQSLIHLDKAYREFFRRVKNKKPGVKFGFPRFKNRYNEQSLSYPQNVKIICKDNNPDKPNALYLPKIGNVKTVFHREISGKVKTVIIKQQPSGRYYASLLVETGVDVPQPVSLDKISPDDIIGIDLGLTDILVDHKSRKIKNPKHLKKALAGLKRHQRVLSRKKKKSNNRTKARIKVARLHEKVKNIRKDYQHKLTKHIIDENQVICIESLNIKRMLKDKHLSRHISDVSWSAFITKLKYKAEWAGKRVISIENHYPSTKTCSCCDTARQSLALSERTWICDICHTEHDRDINAAINIRKRAIEILDKTEKAKGSLIRRLAEGYPVNMPVEITSD